MAELSDRLGRRVRAAREARGLTIDELAADAELGSRTVHYIESASGRSPHLETVEKLAIALGMSIGQLIEDLPGMPAHLEPLYPFGESLDEDDVDVLVAMAERIARLRSAAQSQQITSDEPATRGAEDRGTFDPDTWPEVPSESDLRRALPGWDEVDERGREAILEGFQRKADLNRQGRKNRRLTGPHSAE